MLADNNIVLEDAEDAIYVDICQGISVIMVYDRRVSDILRESFGEIVIASPFGINNGLMVLKTIEIDMQSTMHTFSLELLCLHLHQKNH